MSQNIPLFFVTYLICDILLLAAEDEWINTGSVLSWSLKGAKILSWPACSDPDGDTILGGVEKGDTVGIV